MSNDLPRRDTWAAALANRPDGVHPSAAAVRILRNKLALHPGLEGVNLGSEEIRDAISREVDEKLKFSPDGMTFLAVGPDRRAWDGDEDTVLQKMANSLAVRITAAAEQERPTELTPLEEVAAKRKASGIYSF
jgi:hypothetical protein